MSTSSNNTGRSWVAAAIGGGIVGILLLVVGSGVVIALVVALVIFAAGLMLLPRGKASVSEETRVVSSPAAPAEPASPTPRAPEPAVAETQPEPEPVATEVGPAPEPMVSETEQPSLTASTLIKTSKALPGQVELAARKGTWRFENNSASA